MLLAMTTTHASTAEALIEAATELFSTRGYDAVGIREIAERAGTNVASIKYHFGSKHDLYITMVRQSMGRRDDQCPWIALETIPDQQAAAAAALVRFVHRFVLAMPRTWQSEACSRLMLREVLQPSEATDAVVNDYVRPRHETLMHLVAVLAPKVPPEERPMFAVSLLSQIVHYLVFRPFLDRLGGFDLSEDAFAERLARQISTFSLRGLGFDHEFINDALQDAGLAANDPASIGSA